MEYIKKAVDRARVAQTASISSFPELEPRAARPHDRPAFRRPPEADEVVLKNSFLKAQRIVSHDHTDPRSKAFDMLRTQVLQSMDMKGYRVVAVTSPTPACGKTVISINLALSIARQPERSVVLVDFDLQKGHVARSLGLTCEEGVVSVLEGRSQLERAFINARVGKQRISVLPCEANVSHSSELIGSRSALDLLQTLKSDPSQLVVLDLPPILAGDEVLSLLPHIDCVLFVTAVGTSTIAQIKECTKYLDSVDIVRIVVNKAEDQVAPYYY